MEKYNLSIVKIEEEFYLFKTESEQSRCEVSSYVFIPSNYPSSRIVVTNKNVKTMGTYHEIFATTDKKYDSLYLVRSKEELFSFAKIESMEVDLLQLEPLKWDGWIMLYGIRKIFREEPERAKKAWDETIKYDSSGPTVKEFIEAHEKYHNMKF